MKVKINEVFFDKNYVPFITDIELTNERFNICLKSKSPIMSINIARQLSFIEPDYLLGHIQTPSKYVVIATSKESPLNEELTELIDYLLEKAIVSEEDMISINEEQKQLKSAVKQFLQNLEDDSEEINLVNMGDTILLVEESERYSYHTSRRKDAISYYFNKSLNMQLNYGEWLIKIHRVFQKEIGLYEGKAYVPSEILSRLV